MNKYPSTMIRALQEKDLKDLNKLKPIGWDFDFAAFVKGYKQHDFYHAFVLEMEGQIVGTGNIFLGDKVGWLANIIIDRTYRGRGLGYEMTAFLVEFLKAKKIETQLLIATELGEPVYKKVGFKKIGEYVCFDVHLENNRPISKAIRNLGPADLEEVYKLDKEANDENRRHLIDKHYKKGIGYFEDNNTLIGIFLPDFGRGLVVARSETVGLELLRIKHSKPSQRTMVPIENQKAINYLESIGSKTSVTASRMLLGKENKWNPTLIYSYGGGYCG